MTSSDYDRDTESMQADAEVLPGGSASVSSVRTEIAAAVTTEPWARVKRRIDMPQPLDVRVLDALSDQDFARLVREHLLPAQPQGPEREAWRMLWDLLKRDDGLAHRAFDVLEYLIDTTEAALEGRLAKSAEDPDDPIRRAKVRASKFVADCKNAWERLEIASDEPLAWAGREASAFNPRARVAIQELVTAIAEHRGAARQGDPSEADLRLWSVLDRLKLDPDPRSASAAIRRTR